MANMRRYLDQLLKPAKYNPANYAAMSLEELETLFKGMAIAKGPSPESLALYVFLDCFPEPLEGLSMEEDPLAGLDMRAELQAALDGAPDPWKDLEGVDMSAELQRSIEALEPWEVLEDIEVIEPWEALEDIEDLLRT